MDSLTPEDRDWLVVDERRWRRATEIAQRHPDTDVGGVYHVLRNLEKTPTERLRAALRHGRLFGFHRR
jgi:hypothetical protein